MDHTCFLKVYRNHYSLVFSQILATVNFHSQFSLQTKYFIMVQIWTAAARIKVNIFTSYECKINDLDKQNISSLALA